MPAREEQHVALLGAHPADHAVGARPDLRRRLAAGTAVAEELPVGALGVDLGRGPALVVAIVPLDEVAVELGRVREAGELAGARRALERARPYPGEAEPAQPLAEALRVALAALGERKVRAAGVLAGEAPSRLAVPGEVHDGERATHAGLLPRDRGP